MNTAGLQLCTRERKSIIFVFNFRVGGVRVKDGFYETSHCICDQQFHFKVDKNCFVEKNVFWEELV